MKEPGNALISSTSTTDCLMTEKKTKKTQLYGNKLVLLSSLICSFTGKLCHVTGICQWGISVQNIHVLLIKKRQIFLAPNHLPATLNFKVMSGCKDLFFFLLFLYVGCPNPLALRHKMEAKSLPDEKNGWFSRL